MLCQHRSTATTISSQWRSFTHPSCACGYDHLLLRFLIPYSVRREWQLVGEKYQIHLAIYTATDMS